MPPSAVLYRSGTAVLAVITVGLGVALLVRGALAGNAFAALIGLLFVAAGGGRIFLLRRR